MKLIVFIPLFILGLRPIKVSGDLSISFEQGIMGKKIIDSSSQAVLIKEGNVRKPVDGRSLLLISSNIRSSFFATGIKQGLAQNTVMRLIEIYENFDIDFKKDIMPEDKLEVLFERLSNDQKSEEKVLYTSLTTNKKVIHLYYYKSQNVQEEYFDKGGISLRFGKSLINPLSGDYRVSSNFGSRKHPIHGKVVFHKGVDYAAKIGTPVHAAAEGIVEYIGNNGGYGKYIKIKHKNGYSTCYAHMDKFSSDLKLGSKIRQGQVIAYVGSTGVATGPHLHYEVIYNGKHVNPLTTERKNKVMLPDHELREFKILVDEIDKTIKWKSSSEKEV